MKGLLIACCVVLFVFALVAHDSTWAADRNCASCQLTLAPPLHAAAVPAATPVRSVLILPVQAAANVVHRIRDRKPVRTLFWRVFLPRRC